MYLYLDVYLGQKNQLNKSNIEKKVNNKSTEQRLENYKTSSHPKYLSDLKTKVFTECMLPVMIYSTET